jgi:AcrR family transcriptional regulator
MDKESIKTGRFGFLRGGKAMKKNSKDAIVQAAVSLFNTKGYSGTSIRDIAGKAKVNPANIAYYFQNKHGLLEYCFTSFFEKYISIIEDGYSYMDQGAAFCLKNISSQLLNFLCNNIHLSGFILREMSIDSQLVREIMSTYYTKEKYYLQKLFENGIDRGEFKGLSIPFVIAQLKGFWNMPFLNTAYLREVLYIFPNERYFLEKYSRDIHKWIDDVLCKKEVLIS